MEYEKAPYDKNIYIGTGHRRNTECPGNDAPQYTKNCLVFETRHHGSLTLGVQICSACGAIFLHRKKYEKYWPDFEDYIFISAKTGEPTPEERIKHRDPASEPDYVIQKPDFDETHKTPAYIKHGLMRPFQGGSVSPR